MGKRGNRRQSVVKIRLYVEGGGVRKTSKSACRRGFQRFIEKSGLKGRMPEIIASGSRMNAYTRFAKKSNITANENECALLLVDAEGPVVNQRSWEHLKDRDGWNRPDGTTDDQCHLMVQAMESWFLADRTTLAKHYGPRFQESALPSNPQIEQIGKNDVVNGLIRASRSTTKGSYDKGRHSFEILEKIDPKKVMDASPYAKRLIETLFKLAGIQTPAE